MKSIDFDDIKRNDYLKLIWRECKDDYEIVEVLGYDVRETWNVRSVYGTFKYPIFFRISEKSIRELYRLNDKEIAYYLL